MKNNLISSEGNHLTAMYALNGFSGTVNCKITDLSGTGVRDILVNRTFNSSNPITFGTPPSFTLTETGEYYIEFQATHNSAFALVPGNPHLAATFISIIQMARTVTLTARDQTMAYRYGFNTQMLDNNLAGMGNHLTAQYWEYDPRYGRRWNLDPVRKPNFSSFSVFSLNPIWRIDPDGDDDFFDSNGKLHHSTKKGSNIYVMTAKGNQLLSNVNLNVSANRQAVSNIVGHYATQVGIKHGNKKQGFVGVGRDVESSESTLAFTKGNDIYVNRQGGGINPILNDFNNLKSTLVHEQDHKVKEQGYKNTEGNNFDHANVYYTQVSDPNFLKSSPSFQLGTLGSMSNYLKNASIKEGYQDADIQALVDRTNSAISKTGLALQFRRTSMQSEAINVEVINQKKK